ncbi:VOC family protein [Paenibacillus macquariensis]|uniref:Catechol 2,3-dioxygenase n=1 Tax=Paenibacillus macquariensis TaxID=948756 RepID=A0ABY1JMY1_9BACL|nr:VOC family protein [Paenibacillus macquariensis]MEC0092269.1 VOC family protein [Paenibacillus macquariensis]OAB37187.1 hypothetical protein PMSM_03660 [Paenibacillus macquariensis subsp. macquariensis]SIQ47377.1 Catechol 2,3-dioxygenase [Paenibacillus macquariensis]
MLHHVELNVSNLSVTKDFWGWFLIKLGYVKYQQWEQGVSYKYDNTYIVFVQAKRKYMGIPYHRRRVGLNHLAFHTNSKEQVNEIMIELNKRAVKILYLDKKLRAGWQDTYAVYFEDPDKIKVELVAPMNESSNASVFNHI